MDNKELLLQNATPGVYYFTLGYYWEEPGGDGESQDNEDGGYAIPPSYYGPYGSVAPSTVIIDGYQLCELLVWDTSNSNLHGDESSLEFADSEGNRVYPFQTVTVTRLDTGGVFVFEKYTSTKSITTTEYNLTGGGLIFSFEECAAGITVPITFEVTYPTETTT